MSGRIYALLCVKKSNEVMTINYPGNYLLCIAGATTGSHALLFELTTPPVGIVVRGPGLTPLEFPPDIFAYRIRELCNRALQAFENTYGSIRSRPSVVFSLSSMIVDSVRNELVSAADQSLAGPVPRTHVTWITRGEACLRAISYQGDAVVVKVGTVAFAHAFARHTHNPRFEYRSGGWGLLSGDDGGAYQIGRQVLYRLFAESDGRAQKSALSEFVNKLIGSHITPVSLAQWIRTHRIEQTLRIETSELARVAVRLAEESNDSVCSQLLHRAAAALCSSVCASVAGVRTHDRHFGNDGIMLIIHGALIQQSQEYARHFHRLALRHLHTLGISKIQFHISESSPTLGCVHHHLTNRYKEPIRACRQYLDDLSLLVGKQFAVVPSSIGVKRVFK